MKYLKSILILSSLLSFFSLAQASGVDYKTYNGSSCKSLYSYGHENLWYTDVGIQNKSNRAVTISCPILVDTPFSPKGTSASFIYYKGNPNNGSITCVLGSQDFNGLKIQVKTASRSTTGWLIIPSLTVESPQGSIFLSCTLPKKGQISTIKIGEK
jgi:hypothetical protein